MVHGFFMRDGLCRSAQSLTLAGWRVVDRALDVVGGFGIFPASGLERLVRDARLGRIHPANTHFAREVIAKTTLAINPDEQPRWG